MEHVVDQAATILKHRKVSGLFTTPKLLEALAEKIDSTMRASAASSAAARPWRRNTCASSSRKCSKAASAFIPTYGNTLMGLAASVPLHAGGQVLDHLLRAAAARRPARRRSEARPTQTVDYDEWGRVELTTLTKEFFMPRFLERDEAIRRKPRAPYAWDGVAEVRPFGAMEKTIVEGVY